MISNESAKAMALVDGQLDPNELPALVRELARDPDLVAQAQGYLAVSRARVGEVYRDVDVGPTPPWLIDTVMRAQATAPGARHATPLVYVRDLLGRMGEACRVPAWTLAAGPALAAALVALGAWLLVPAAGQGEALASAALQSALETSAGERHTAALAFHPRATFQDGEKHWCRQFDAQFKASKRAVAAIACRSDGGNWRIVVEAPAAPDAGSVSRPAGPGVIKQLVQSMASGSLLDRSEVQQRMGSGWSRE